MQKITQYSDDNFLNGQLKIIVDHSKKTTIGKFTFYDYNFDKIIDFTAITKCNKNDTFDENIGINIIKLKLVKQYYSYKKKIAQKTVESATKILNDAMIDYNYTSKKLENIKSELSKYGLAFYNKDNTKQTAKKDNKSIKRQKTEAVVKKSRTKKTVE